MWNADVIGSHNEGGGKTIYIRKNKTTQQQKIPVNVLSLQQGFRTVAILCPASGGQSTTSTR
jgi:hypothetical protein